MKLRRNHISRSSKIKVGITLGDPSGIGPAITLKALKALKGVADFTVIGDVGVFNKTQSLLGVIARRAKPDAAILSNYNNLRLLRAKNALAMTGCRFIDLKNVQRENFEFGKVKAEYGRASIEYIDKALELINNKEIDCLVTCPVSKEAINLAHEKFSGHTEYLAAKSKSKNIAMMLLNDRLKFILLTRHIPLSQVSANIQAKELERVILLSLTTLRNYFGLGKPRIVVCGLNPHASDNGVLGREEVEIIQPVISKLNQENQGTVSLKGNGPCVFGPFSADVAIAKALCGEFDCIIAMYHDQALIPLKLLDAGACPAVSPQSKLLRCNGVNLTLGLPFIRTSPLHGTAFDIAALPKEANPASLIAAIKLAVKCASIQKKA